MREGLSAGSWWDSGWAVKLLWSRSDSFYCLHHMTFVFYCRLPLLSHLHSLEGLLSFILSFFVNTSPVNSFMSFSCIMIFARSYASGPDIMQTQHWWQILPAVRLPLYPAIDYPSAGGHKWLMIIWLKNIFPTSDLSLEVNKINPAGPVEHDFTITRDLLLLYCLLLHHRYVGRSDKWGGCSLKKITASGVYLN